MAFGLLGAVVGGSIVSGLFGSSAAKKGAKATQQAADASIAEQRRQYDTTRADYQPFMQTGYAALNDINSLYGRSTGANGTVTGGGAPDMSRFFTSPDFTFNLAQGQQAIDRSLAARSGVLSGAAVKAGTRFASGLASREFGDYYNRLASQAGLGQSATGSVAGAGANMAGANSSAILNAGNQRASAYTQGASAVNNAVQGGIGNLLLMRYLTPGGA